MPSTVELLLALGLLGPTPAQTPTADSALAADETQQRASKIVPGLEQQIRDEPGKSFKVVVMFVDNVDVAELTRKYPSASTRLRVLRRIRKRQQDPIFARFARAGLRLHNVRRSHMVNAAFVTATGSDIVKMAEIKGVDRIHPQKKVRAK